MQFEDFDNKVRDAADHYYPAYDEKAWNKMEKLLNRHLPQNDDNRRRLLFFLLLFVLLGGGAWLLIGKPWQNGKPLIVNSQPEQENKQVRNPFNVEDKTTVPESSESPVSRGGNAATNGSSTSVTDVVSTNKTKKDPNTTSLIVPVTQENKTIARKNVDKTNKPETSGERKPLTGKKKPVTTDPVQENENLKLIEKSKTDPVVQNKLPEAEDKEPVISDEPVTKKNVSEQVKKETEEKKLISNEKKKQEEAAVNKAPEPVAKKAKGKNKDKSPLFFSVSSGPDVSAVRAKNAGDTKLLSGAGIGYSFFDEKLIIRSGFYIARKIYTALPKDYKPKEPIPTPDWLTKIDADCKVYEIPLNLSYNFGNSKKQNFFAGAGLSSYFMKKEVYEYEYVYFGGPPFTYTHTVDNKNKHYFSVLNLSAGYTRKFGKTISLTAEPYVKVPLKGIGYGNVKLNSAGVLVSLNIRPFNAKETKPLR